MSMIGSRPNFPPAGGASLLANYPPQLKPRSPLLDQPMPGQPMPALLQSPPVSAMNLPEQVQGLLSGPQPPMAFGAPHIKAPFFMPDGTGTGNKILGVLSDVLLSAGGKEPWYTPMMQARQERELQNAQAQSIWQQRHDVERQDAATDREDARNAPQYFSGNQDRVRYDPRANKTEVVYDAPTEAEAYANSLGYEPGSPEYQSAQQDYVLRANGPTAFGGRSALEGIRFGNRAALKGMPTFAQTHPKAPSGGVGGGPRTTGNVFAPVLDKMRRGLPLTQGETQVMNLYNRGGGRGRGRAPFGGAAEQTATGPGGHKIVLRGGRWLDAATGRPVQ